MRKLAIALLTTSMLAAPAAFAASSNQPPPKGAQMKQGQQMRHNQPQSQQNTQNQQKQPNAPQQSAQNTQPIQPKSMSRGEVRQVQQALDKDGFKAGRTDGRWGDETQAAVKQFQRSKQLQATGKLNEQTVADLGLDASKFPQPQQNQQR
ncbi:MAG TPA: peptidoglycan-binding domain-containing protein [Rhizobiaceae bacterium]|nr:peptidoglycan-binding domain-containing protein [Rhizobiaceae bacterium]